MSPVDLLLRVWPPMLATAASSDEVGPDDRLEVKYDGFRALGGLSRGRVALQSRNGLDLSVRFPGVAGSLSLLASREAVLDGEVVAGAGRGGRFQALQGAAADLRYVAFDLLWLEGRDLRARPLGERLALLEELVKGVNGASPPASVRRRRAVVGPRHGPGGRAGVAVAEVLGGPVAAALERARSEGFEGVVAKRRDSAYVGGRSRSWLKVKVLAGQEVVVVGYTPISNGARAIGALLVATFDGQRFVYAGKVGTGYDERTRRELLERLEPHRTEGPTALGAPRMRDARWVTPRLVAQVAFAEWTADGRLRHPAFQGLRDDKRPEEVRREVKAPPPGGARPPDDP